MRYLSDLFAYLARIARVSYTHTRARARVDTVLGYLIAPVFHRRRALSLLLFPSPHREGPGPYDRDQRRVNANFIRTIAFSSWIIRRSWEGRCSLFVQTNPPGDTCATTFRQLYRRRFARRARWNSIVLIGE